MRFFLVQIQETTKKSPSKFESVKATHPQLFYEAKLYQYLHKDRSAEERGVPQVYYCATEGESNVMVMEYLGSNLEDLFNICNRKFSLKTTLMVGEQMLARIEYLQSRYIMHRDIKPDNFVIGHGQKQHKVYMIDYGLAKRYIGRDGYHIPYKEGKSLTGTARYASINTHLGIEQGRRDDLESLGYVMLYFLRGNLPWQNMGAANKKQKYTKIMEKKLGTPVEVLCKGLPAEFSLFLTYCRNLKFEDKPDYAYLKTMLKNLFEKSGFVCDYEYDWVAILKKKKLEESKKNEIAANLEKKNNIIDGDKANQKVEQRVIIDLEGPNIVQPENTQVSKQEFLM